MNCWIFFVQNWNIHLKIIIFEDFLWNFIKKSFLLTSKKMFLLISYCSLFCLCCCYSICLRQTLTVYLWIAWNWVSGPGCPLSHWECFFLSTEIKSMCRLTLITHLQHYVTPFFYVTIRNSVQNIFSSLKTVRVPSSKSIRLFLGML